MAIRSEVVRPDEIIEGIDGQGIMRVSREAIIDATVRAVDAMLLTGGEFTVTSQRVPTGYAHESVCAVVGITWRNHSNAKPQEEPHIEPRQEIRDGMELAQIEADDADDFDLRQSDEDEDEADSEIPTAVH